MICGAELEPAATGRPRQTCSDAHRQKAYRERLRGRLVRGEHHAHGRLADYAEAAGLSRAETRRAVQELIWRRHQELDRQRRAGDRMLFADEVPA
jgi:hypothetical protein